MGTIIDEAMETVKIETYEVDEGYATQDKANEKIRSAIEHAVRRCAEVAATRFGDNSVIVSEILRAAGLER